MKLSKLSRVVHRWGSILAALPLLVMIAFGVTLQLKKEVAWIQPPTQQGAGQQPSISFERILEAAQTAPEAKIESWNDIDRLDVRPSKGMVKVRSKNRWEIQIDTHTGKVLQVAYRRSDLLESLHIGSFFHDSFKVWVFLPAGVILAVLWATGVYLFLLPYLAKWNRRQKKVQARSQNTSPKSTGLS